MDKQQIWGARVREWRSSGESRVQFSRGKEFTATALGYWIKRLQGSKHTSGAPTPLRIARVVRTQGERGSEPTSGRATAQALTPTMKCLVIEAGALRVHVPQEVEAGQLEAVLLAVGRALKAGAA